MTPCLRPDEMIDVLDGVAGGAALAHVETCADCQALLTEMRAALGEAAHADVPEPSPLFWSQVNARVRSAIASEPQPAAAQTWWSWLRIDVLVPLAGLAAIVVALTTTLGRVTLIDQAPVAGAETRVEAATGMVDLPGAGDGALELVVDLVASLPDGGWDTLGLEALPDLDVAARSLSADEQRALQALLQAAVERPQS